MDSLNHLSEVLLKACKIKENVFKSDQTCKFISIKFGDFFNISIDYSLIMYKKLKTYFSTFVVPSEEEWADISQCFRVKKVPKNSFLLQEGAVCREMSFINKGLCRSYQLKDGKEITNNFFFEGSFIADYSSFTTQKLSFQYIQTLEKTEIVYFSYQDMQHYYEKYFTMQKFGRLIAEKVILNIYQREQAFLLYTPKERYLNLIEKRPKVILNLPQIYVASYLGITPEYLSRLRRELKHINSERR